VPGARRLGRALAASNGRRRSRQRAPDVFGIGWYPRTDRRFAQCADAVAMPADLDDRNESLTFRAVLAVHRLLAYGCSERPDFPPVFVPARKERERRGSAAVAVLLQRAGDGAQ